MSRVGLARDSQPALTGRLWIAQIKDKDLPALSPTVHATYESARQRIDEMIEGYFTIVGGGTPEGLSKAQLRSLFAQRFPDPRWNIHERTSATMAPTTGRKKPATCR